MFILGIESSCDETAISIIEQQGLSFKVLSERISSQAKLHEKYGGVVPEVAAREHIKALPLIYDQVMREANLKLSQIATIAVTCGPGLKGCLLSAMNFAEGLACYSAANLVAVNHIEGHLLVSMLDNPELKPPYLSLIVSGGHTEIVQVKDLGDYTIISRTIDDAAGEAFDKSADLLGFAYPGGAKLAALADSVTSSRFTLPRIMPNRMEFSFSGLKTAIALLIQKHRQQLLQDASLKAELAYTIQSAIVSQLRERLELAIKQTNIRKLALGGGVSANQALRRAVLDIPKSESYFTRANWCTDNATMIAYAGALVPRKYTPLVYPRWPLEDLSNFVDTSRHDAN